MIIFLCLHSRAETQVYWLLLSFSYWRTGVIFTGIRSRSASSPRDCCLLLCYPESMCPLSEESLCVIVGETVFATFWESSPLGENSGQLVSVVLVDWGKARATQAYRFLPWRKWQTGLRKEVVIS